MFVPSKLILQIALFALLSALVQPAFAGKAPPNNSDEESLYNVLQTQANQQAQQQKQTPAPPNPGPDSQPSGPPPEGPPR